MDYRKLNAVTKKESYPLPRIDDALDALSGSKIFTTLDLQSTQVFKFHCTRSLWRRRPLFLMLAYMSKM